MTRRSVTTLFVGKGGEAVRALDVIVKDVGAVWQFTPVSDEAKEWFKENVLAEPWQWLGPSLAADRHPAQVLHAEIRRRGLRIQGWESS
jgi:hypothetical protein